MRLLDYARLIYLPMLPDFAILEKLTVIISRIVGDNLACTFWIAGKLSN